MTYDSRATFLSHEKSQNVSPFNPEGPVPPSCSMRGMVTAIAATVIAGGSGVVLVYVAPSVLVLVALLFLGLVPALSAGYLADRDYEEAGRAQTAKALAHLEWSSGYRQALRDSGGDWETRIETAQLGVSFKDQA
jgi:hypothetical protein